MKHYSKAVMSLKILFDDKEMETEKMEKYVNEAGVIL